MAHLWLVVLLQTVFTVDYVTSVEPPTPSPFSDINQVPQGPVFISEPPTTVVFPNTRGVTIPCTAYGRPAPVMDWIRTNGSEVTSVPGLLEVLSNNSLHFLPFVDDNFRVDVHTGSFRCMASNTGGAIISRKVHIKAVLLSRYRTYNVRVNDIYVTRGNTAVFECSIDPYYVRDHVVVTSWTQSGKVLQNDARVSVLHSGELLVRGVQDEDSYQAYRCVTRNVITGEERTSDPATLYVIDPVNSIPNLEDLSKEIHVHQGARAELPCAGSAFPLPTYTWSRDGISIRINQSRVTQYGGSLIIDTVIVADSGEYTCTVENSLGKTSIVIYLIVTATLSAFIEPAHQTIDVGHSALLNCTVFGHPVLGVEWYKDGRALQSSDRITMVTEYSLRILQVERHDFGMYQCMIWNSEDNSQAAAQLSIGVAKPYMIFGFEDKTVSAGPGVSLQCSASGNPTPTVQWTLDDSPLPLESRYSMGSKVTQEGDIISYLNISNVRVQDGGQYTCLASNPAGSAQHLGRLNVYGVPYIRTMSNVTAVANEMLVLRCYVTGYPVEVITWRKGESVLPVNHRQQVSLDGMLTIHNVNRDHDEGQYSCDARNDGDQGMRRSLYINVMEPPKIDTFSFSRREQGDRVSVMCVVSSGDLPITITWLWNNQPVDPETGIVVQKMGSYTSLLSISDVDPRHNGNYTCNARNEVASTSYTAQLHVHIAPVWVTEPADSYVILGGSVVLDCQASGDPRPTVEWRKATVPGRYKEINATEITASTPALKARLQRFPNGSLVLHGAVPSDSGHYLCQASNGIGASLGKVIQLAVHVPAHFPEREGNYSVLQGNNISMECVADGDRPLSVSWSFNGGNLNWQSDGRLEVVYYNTVNGRGSRLTIQPAHRQDSGFYVCNAKNIFGSDSKTVYLIVLEKPDPPDVTVYTGGSRDVTLQWTAPYNGNSPITAYLIQVKGHQSSWESSATINVTVIGGEKSVVIKDLHPAYEYSLRVMAVNSFGPSAPSQTVDYTTQTEEPSGAPEDVDAIATGSQSLLVAWRPPAPEKQNGEIRGYYVGYKVYNASAPYMYLTESVENLLTTRDPLPAGSDVFLEPGEETRLLLPLDTLEKFTQYALHVQAYNDQGAGPRSQDILVFTLEDVPSQAPQNVQATPLSSQSVMVVWNPPPLYTLHGILQGYKVFYKPVRDDEDESDSLSQTTSKLSTAIFGLQKYTNYSIQVLAYTRKGEGVRSKPLYVRTQPDLPERPADIKAVPAGPTSIYVSWRPPLHPNGQIMKYILHIKDLSINEAESRKVQLPTSQLSFLVTNLTLHHQYSFSVGANTVVGDGEVTYDVIVSALTQVGARIGSFSGEMYTHWHNDVLLPCQAVGEPSPTVTWRKRSQPIIFDDRVKLMPNGSLLVSDIQGSDAANYTCRVENTHGADEITVTLIVQVDSGNMTPPKQPVVTIAATTPTIIQVNWRSGSNGGSKIQGFHVSYKRQHGEWWTERLPPTSRSYTATELRCGTQYSFRVRAFNRVGEGIVSDTVTIKTNGSLPIMPAQSLILQHINSTYIMLDLTTWQSGGCPVTAYDIHYQYWGDSSWHLVQSHIDPEQLQYRIDLHPATWYIVRVTAHNEAGSTECVLKFSTKTYEGNTIEPVKIVHHYWPKFYERTTIMIPLCAAVVFIIVTSVGVALYCRRKHRDYQYKEENASNLRKDLTAESFLMSDVDKPSNLAPDHTYSPDPGSQKPRNNSHQVEAQSRGESPTGSGLHDTSRSSCNTDDEGNIKPYATCPHKPINTDTAAEHYPMEFDPDLDKLPPPPVYMLQDISQKSYDNEGQGILLTPRPLADIGPDSYRGDLSHAALHLPLFQFPSFNLHKNAIAPQKAGQRHSLVSNVSSNHDELVQALGHPPSTQHHSPGGSTYHRGQGEIWDRGSSTIPRAFTQSPAAANEQRKASCEVPLYPSSDGDKCTTLPHASGQEQRHPPFKNRPITQAPPPPQRFSLGGSQSQGGTIVYSPGGGTSNLVSTSACGFGDAHRSQIYEPIAPRDSNTKTVNTITVPISHTMSSHSPASQCSHLEGGGKDSPIQTIRASGSPQIRTAVDNVYEPYSVTPAVGIRPSVPDQPHGDERRSMVSGAPLVPDRPQGEERRPLVSGAPLLQDQPKGDERRPLVALTGQDEDSTRQALLSRYYRDDADEEEEVTRPLQSAHNDNMA